LDTEGAHVDFLDGVSAQHLLGQHGYAAIFVIVMLESAGIPMPGETNPKVTWMPLHVIMEKTW
jgi:hypothetical protein